MPVGSAAGTEALCKAKRRRARSPRPVPHTPPMPQASSNVSGAFMPEKRRPVESAICWVSAQGSSGER